MAKKMRMLDQKLEIMKNCLPESKNTSPVESNLHIDKKPEVCHQVLPHSDQNIIGRLNSVESVEDIHNNDTPARRQSYNRRNSTSMTIQENPLEPSHKNPSTLLENLSTKIKNSLNQKSKKLRQKNSDFSLALNQNSSKNLFSATPN